MADVMFVSGHVGPTSQRALPDSGPHKIGGPHKWAQPAMLAPCAAYVAAMWAMVVARRGAADGDCAHDVARGSQPWRGGVRCERWASAHGAGVGE